MIDGDCTLRDQNTALNVCGPFKDVRGWQILTVEAAETLCMVCLPPEEHMFRKKYSGNRPFKKSHFIKV